VAAFIEHSLRGTNHATARTGTPLDFIAFHAKGAPTTVDGHVRMGIATHLRTIDAGFATVASYPELRKTPIVIGESDPEGCAACQGPQLAYRSGTMYSSYTAASFALAHDLADRHGVDLEGAVTWAFEFEDQPYFPGFRALASSGLDLPVLNVFRMFSRMVMVWHYHDDDVPGPEAAVTLDGSGLPVTDGAMRLSHCRIDETHSNAYGAWRRMGSPLAPNRDQYTQLEAEGRLSLLEPPSEVAVAGGMSTVKFALPRQAVSLLVFE